LEATAALEKLHVHTKLKIGVVGDGQIEGRCRAVKIAPN
jgi:hypothetical protein